MERSPESASTGNLAPSRDAGRMATWQHTRPDEEIAYGEVSFCALPTNLLGLLHGPLVAVLSYLLVLDGVIGHVCCWPKADIACSARPDKFFLRTHAQNTGRARRLTGGCAGRRYFVQVIVLWPAR